MRTRAAGCGCANGPRTNCPRGCRPLRTAGGHPGLGCAGGDRGTGAHMVQPVPLLENSSEGFVWPAPTDAPCSLCSASLKCWCRGGHPSKQGTDQAGSPTDFKQIRWDVLFPLRSFEVEFCD